MTTARLDNVVRDRVSPARVVLAAALVVGAVLFVIGTRGEHHESATPPASASVTTSAAEGTPGHEAAEGSPTGSAHAETAAEKSSEKVFGANLESGWIVAVVVTVSIVVAGLVLARRPPYVVWVATGFCALAAVADLAELARQVDRSETALALVAAAVAVTHVTGAVGGLVATREPV